MVVAVVQTCYSAKHMKITISTPQGTDFDKTWHGWLHPGSHPTWQLWWE